MTRKLVLIVTSQANFRSTRALFSKSRIEKTGIDRTHITSKTTEGMQASVLVRNFLGDQTATPTHATELAARSLTGHSRSIKRQLSASRLCSIFCTSEGKVLGGGPFELIYIKGRNAGDCGELNRLNASSADYIPDQDGRPIKSLFCNRKQKRIAGMKTWVG